jgi:hypothetical protein
MKAIRWGDNDRYFGPFTYAPGDYWRLAAVLGSGDDDDYPGCRLRVGLGRRSFLVALPQIIRPWRRKVFATRGMRRRSLGWGAIGITTRTSGNTGSPTATASCKSFWALRHTTAARRKAGASICRGRSGGMSAAVSMTSPASTSILTRSGAGISWRGRLGTIAGMLLASVDTRPEGGDATEIAAPFTSGAVPEGQTPKRGNS